jgi:hypothetical protein
MDLNKAAYDILKKMGYEDIEFVFERKRHNFPHAIYAYSPKEVQDIIVVEGNEPSLARFGLAMLIIHEISHFEYRRKYKSSPYEDFTEEFKKIERELIEKLWIICSEEHENEK